MRTCASLRLPLGAALLTALLSSTALSQVPADISVERNQDAARIILTYDPELIYGTPNAEAAVEHSVLIANLSEPVAADISELADQLGDLAVRVRLDEDGTALRIALNGPAEAAVSTSYNVVAIDLVPPGAPEFPPVVSPRERRERDQAAAAAEAAARAPVAPPPADPVPVTYDIGQTAAYSRIELNWPEPVTYELTQTGNVAEIRFGQPADIALNRLAGSPPRFVERVSSERLGDEWILRLILQDGVTARAWDEGPQINVDLPDPDEADAQAILAQLAGLEDGANGESETPAAAETEEQTSSPVPVEGEGRTEETAPPVLQPEIRINPVPETGIVQAAAAETNGDLLATFTWEAPVGASVFRRGEAIWIVFDASAVLNLDELAFSQRGHVRSFETVQGADYTAARIVAPASTQAEARPQGNTWTIVFSERIESPPRPIPVRRDARRGRPGRLILDLDGAQPVRWVTDPVVGDRIGVVTSTGPVQGMTTRRDFVGGALLASAHGAAIEAIADDVDVRSLGRSVTVGRGAGLSLTPTNTSLSDGAEVALLANISSPAYMDFDGWRGEGLFREEWPARQRRAAMENGPDGRIALARFLLAHELAPETLGMVDLAISMEPQLATDSHIRSLQGVASFLMGRYDEAEEYLIDPSLALDPAANLWRGMVALKQERWGDARRRLEAGEPAAFHYPPEWRARFEIAQAWAALELGDFPSAQSHLHTLAEEEPDYQTQLEAAYVSARLAAAEGDIDTAVRRLERLAESRTGSLESRAIYDLINIQLDAGLISRADAIDGLENLSFRYRGDTIELDTVRTLGELYVEDGAFTEGMATMMRAQSSFPDTEAGRRIGDEMARIFRRLFLEGEADRMDPIQAVGLFYQYQSLAPLGTDGDRMIRRLADRLIAFDLLDPAADLLQHQVEVRLREPVARARVATDLAVIYLMDRRYEDALNTLASSRVARLPAELVADRYLLEARALAELDRHEHALELVADNRSPAADRLRADIAWDQGEWAAAGRRLETILGSRWTRPGGLSQAEENDLIRAAIAYNLARDNDSAQRLGERYGEAMSLTEQAAAFEVFTSPDTPPGGIRLTDLPARVATIDTLDAFMAPFRARFNSNTGDNES